MFTAFRMLFFVLCQVTVTVHAQLPSKQVRQQSQVWLSMNAHYRFNQHWGVIGDVHIRRNNFLKDPKAPVLVLSDELLIQFGKELVYNTFDQNRFFIGIRQNLSKQFSYDFGYMNVYQQRITGYQYDMNHTIRLFFYYAHLKKGER